MAEEKEKPLSREDVERKIKEHDNIARGLDLSGKTFEEGIDLQALNLEGIILKDARFPTHFEGNELVGAKFNGSNLTAADLRNINLQYAQFGVCNGQTTCLEAADLRGTILLNANFQCADLTGAKFGEIEGETLLLAMSDNTDFRGANLFRANFKGCYFYGTKLEGASIRGADILEAHLEEADWGSYVIGEENKKDFYSAESIYRQLKMWYTEHGMYDVAGEFYYREREARRKALKWKSGNWHHRLAIQISYLVFGHGERWRRIPLWMLFPLIIFAMAYYFCGNLEPLDSLYFSAVSFTALGYGNWVVEPTGWVKLLGAVEAFIGVLMMALLLVTIVRRWAR